MKLLKPDSMTLRADFIAGITVALVLIPQSLAYASLAGLPPHYGLYASLLPPVIAAFFGSSKHLSTGPVGVVTLMTAASLSLYAKPGSDEYIALALLLAFGLGMFQLILGLIKLGGLASFLSHPVIYGFTNAAAIIIATTQLPKFFGVKVGDYEHHYQTVIAVFEAAANHVDIVTLLVGIWALLAMYTMRVLNKKIPAVLIVVVCSTIFSWLMHYNGAIVGYVPKGLPRFAFIKIDIEVLLKLIPTIITMAIIGFTEAISVAQTIAVKTKERLDPNKELIGQGLANIVGSFNQSYSVSGSFSRTAVSFQAGAKSPYSSLFTSIMVLLTLLFFTQTLFYLPQVVLAAVIIISVIGLIDFKKIRYIWFSSKYDAVAAILTFFGTLYYAPHLDKGIVIGVVFSVGYYLYRNIHPRVVFLSKYKDTRYHDAERFRLDRCKNIAVIRLDSPLFFANATFFENEVISDIADNPEITDIIIVANGINYIDATGEEKLAALFDALRLAKKQLYISDAKLQVLEVLTRTGLRDEIGKKHFFSSIDEGVEFIVTHLEREHKHLDKAHCPLKKYIHADHGEKSFVKDRRETIAYFYHKVFGRS